MFLSKVPKPLEDDGEALFEDGNHVVDVEHVDGLVNINCQDVVTLEECMLVANLVIAADGLNSFVRRTFLPEVE